MVTLRIPAVDSEYLTIAPADPTVDAQVIAAIRLQVPSGHAKAKHIGSGTATVPEYAWELNVDDTLTQVAGPGAANLTVDNITTTTLDVASDSGTDATLPAAVAGVSAGLMTAADKTALDAAAASNTNLTVGLVTTTTLDVESSTGTNATIPAALAGTAAGLLTAADKTLVDTIAGKLDAADLSIGTTTTTTIDIDSSGGTSATIPSAVAGVSAGLMSAADKTKLDGASGITNLSVGSVNSLTLDIESSSGSNATIPAATGSDSGLLTATGFTSIASIASKLETVDLSIGTVTTTTVDIDSSAGTSATIPVVVAGVTAGLMSSADKTLLDSLPTAGNLSVANVTTTTLDVASDIGTDATIPAAVANVSAGLMTAADKAALDAAPATNTNITTGTVNAATGARSIPFGTNTLDFTGLVSMAIDSSFEATSLILPNGAFAITLTAPVITSNFGVALPTALPTAQQVTDQENYLTLDDSGQLSTGATPATIYITQGTMVAATENRTVDLGGFDLDFVNVNACSLDSPVTATSFTGTTVLLERASNAVSITTNAAQAVSYSLAVPLVLPTAGEEASGDNYVRVTAAGQMEYGAGGGGGGGGSQTHEDVATVVARDALSPAFEGYTVFVSENQTTYRWNGADWDMIGGRVSGTATERAALTNVEDGFMFDDVSDRRTYRYDSALTPVWIEF